MPRGRLPVVPDGHPGSASAATPAARRPTVPLPEPEPCVRRRRARAAASASAAPASSPSPRCSAWRRCSTGGTRAGSTRPGLSQKARPGRLRPAHLDRDGDRGQRQSAGRDASTSCSASTCSARATPSNLRVAEPERTVAVVSTSVVPTGQMVIDPASAFPTSTRRADGDRRRDARGRQRLPRRPGALARRCSATTCRPTCCVLGAAWQQGADPAVAATRCEQAIRLNGAAVEQNLAAFDVGPRGRGRAGGGRGDAAHGGREPCRAGRRRALVDRGHDRADGELRRLLERPRRRPRSAGAGARRRAATSTTSRRVHASEQARLPGSDRGRPRPSPAACTS